MFSAPSAATLDAWRWAMPAMRHLRDLAPLASLFLIPAVCLPRVLSCAVVSIVARQAPAQRCFATRRLPQYLTVQMVRFFYKAATQQKAKILRKVSSPIVTSQCCQIGCRTDVSR